MSDTITCVDCGIPVGVPPEEIEDRKEYRCVRCQIGNEVVRLKQEITAKDTEIERLQSVADSWQANHAELAKLVKDRDTEIAWLKNTLTRDTEKLSRLLDIIRSDKAITDTLWFDEYNTVVGILESMLLRLQEIRDD